MGLKWALKRKKFWSKTSSMTCTQFQRKRVYRIPLVERIPSNIHIRQNPASWRGNEHNFLILFGKIHCQQIFVFIVPRSHEFAWFRITNELRNIFGAIFSSCEIGNFVRCRRSNRIKWRNRGYRCKKRVHMFWPSNLAESALNSAARLLNISKDYKKSIDCWETCEDLLSVL